jgi:hypothetical protein
MSSEIISLAIVALTLVLMAVFWLWARRSGRPATLRQLAAFQDLPQRTGESVESGKRIHLSLGSGAIGGPNTASALAGLNVLEAVAEASTVSDKPPIVTAGDGGAMMLAQNAFRRAYRRQNVEDRYDHLASRLAGTTALSYTAGVMTTLKDEDVSTNIVIGSLGPEVALIADAGWGQKAHQVIGVDNVEAQAQAYATADRALIGEDMFATGAYLGNKPLHRASLQAQDVLRILIVGAILAGPIIKLLIP